MSLIDSLSIRYSLIIVGMELLDQVEGAPTLVIGQARGADEIGAPTAGALDGVPTAPGRDFGMVARG